jgi:hypothetical protein
MRQILLILTVFFGQTFIGYSQAPYKINSCKIDFVFATGSFQKGTKTLVFADFGKVEKQFGVTYLDTSANTEIPKGMLGNRTVFHTLQIQTPDSVFSVDLDLMTGKKRVKFGFTSSLIDDQMIKVREDTFLGRKCNIMDFNGVKLWYWKGIVLKKEMPIDGIYEYATSIDENYVVKEDEFQVAKGVKMQ